MLKAPDFSGMDPAVRSFVLICIGVAFVAWDIGFELGAYGRIFFEKLFMVWSISTALLITLVLVPSRKFRVPAITYVVAAFPSFWLLLALVVRASPDDIPELRLALFLSGLLVYLGCFPYAIYMALSVAYPDLLSRGGKRPKVALLFIVVALFSAGYLMGVHHQKLVTCEDFEISGNYVPEDCRPEHGRQRLFQ